MFIAVFLCVASVYAAELPRLLCNQDNVSKLVGVLHEGYTPTSRQGLCISLHEYVLLGLKVLLGDFDDQEKVDIKFYQPKKNGYIPNAILSISSASHKPRYFALNEDPLQGAPQGLTAFIWGAKEQNDARLTAVILALYQVHGVKGLCSERAEEISAEMPLIFSKSELRSSLPTEVREVQHMLPDKSVLQENLLMKCKRRVFSFL